MTFQKNFPDGIDLEHRFQALFNRPHDAIFLLDMGLRVLDCNPCAADLLGASTPQEMIGRSIYDFIYPNLEMPSRYWLEKLLDHGTTGSFEYVLHRRDGEKRVLDMCMDLLPVPGQPYGYIQWLARDTEPRRLQHEELIQKLLQNIAHDSRTPISVIKSSLYLLHRKLGETSPHLDHLQMIDMQTNRIHRMMENALIYARLAAGQVEFSLMPVDLAWLADLVIKEMVDRFQSKALQIEQTHQPLPPVPMDGSYLKIVLEHLLLNACEFTPTGGSVRVQTARGKDYAIIRVMDNGIGMAPESRLKLFQPFYKGDESRSSGGNGLGLPIVRAIIEAHRGTVEIHSVPGEGTVIALTLPLEQAS